MAHFAKIENNIVTNVIVIDNIKCNGFDFPDSEPIGQAFIASLGFEGEWLQTSFNGNFRKCFAGVGYSYDSALDKFLSPKPYPSWLLNENHDWEAPTSIPDTDGRWFWNEENQEWVR